jgi:hypothetical protein
MPDQELPERNVDILTRARERLIEQHNCSEEEAEARLRESLRTLLENPVPPPAPPPEPPVPPIPPLDEEPRPATRKKATYVDFDANATIASRIPHHPSEYAVGKMEDIEYVELWYFTTEGCEEASKATPTVADEAFNLLKMKTGLALQPIKATKASPNAIVDEHLSWEQIMTARHTMIATANQVGWDQKLMIALAELYIGLEGLKASGTNARALILYHAVARKLWHNALRGRGKPFNVSNINQDLLLLLENQVRDTDHADMRKIALEAQRQTLELQRQASPYKTSLTEHPTNILSLHARYIYLSSCFAMLLLPPSSRNVSPTPRDSQ